MKILTVHPDKVSLILLKALAAREGRCVDAYSFIEDALGRAKNAQKRYDLGLLRLEGEWENREKVERSVEKNLKSDRVLWLDDDTTLGEIWDHLDDSGWAEA